MPRIADYLTLWDSTFQLGAAGDKGIDFTMPSDTNLGSPTVLLFNFAVVSSPPDVTIGLAFKISINDIDVYDWKVDGCGIQILTSSHHEVISGQVLRHGTNANRIEVVCQRADTGCFMKFSDAVLMFQRNI